MPRSRQANAEPKRSERETVVTLRLPKELHERLKEAGGERGLTAQIRDRLDASLAVEEACDDPVFADLMRAMGYLVVTAGLLYRGDPDLYQLIDFATRRLLDAFRPEGTPSIIEELYVPTTAQMLSKAERLIGAALGAMGEVGVAKLASLGTMQIKILHPDGSVTDPPSGFPTTFPFEEKPDGR